MNELYQVSKIVKVILEQDELARNSDSWLYLRVLFFKAEEHNIDLYKVNVPDFMIHMKQWGLPGFETVRRARQKAQQHNPELASAEKVAAMRQANEAEYRAFARGGRFVNKSPCYECPDRHRLCHAECEKYIAFRAERDEALARQRQMNENKSAYYETTKNVHKKWMRRKMRGEKV